MSFYSDASLIVIPSGYKASKVYSAVPTDGSGDLTFTRSNDTATRVNSAGLIEKVRTNLILYSQEFDNAYWVKSSSGVASTPVVTANAEIAPDGTMTAERIVFNLNGGTSLTDFSMVNSAGFTTAAQENTSSIFLKTTDGTTKTIQITAPDGTSSLATVTGTYQRFTITSAGAASASSLRIRLRGTLGTSDSASLAVWGAQFESGVATDYIPTTTAAVSVGPVANVPRLDYLNSTCPKLLLEPQRTNLVTFSEQFGNAAWTKDGITITANATTSPDGYANADKLVASAAAGDKIAYQVLTVTNSVAYTSSAYFKASEYNYAFFRLGGIDGNPYVIYNLATQAVVSTSGLITSTITSVGNGWYRVTVTATQTSTTLAPVLMFLPTTGYTLSGSNIPQFTGNGTSGGFVWGVQSELGAYATSIIPTLAASVTRGADACSKTGISSLIGQTEGVLFYDFVWNGSTTGAGDYPIVLSGTDFNNFIGLNTAANTNQLLAYSGGAIVAAIAGSSLVVGQRYKIALAYKLNDFVYYRNGALIGSDTSGAVPIGLANLRMTSPFEAKSTLQNANSILFFPTRLTNAQLAQLTTI